MSFNQKGELEIRGPQVMKGCYKQDKETQNVLDSKGWLKTGDIAKINEQGIIQILDRKKDMINISGLKVYPNELENVLVNHPDIKEAGVTSEKNEKQYIEIIKVFIVKKTN